MIAVAPESNDLLMQELETTIKAKDDIECELDITIVVETKSDHNGHKINLCIGKNVLLPTFSMYALFPMDEDWPTEDRLSIVIDIPSTHYSKVRIVVFELICNCDLCITFKKTVYLFFLLY